MHELSTEHVEPLTGVDWLESPVGPLIFAATAQAVCLLQFAERDRLEGRLRSLAARCAGAPGNPHLVELRHQLQQYFAGERREFTVPLAARGSEFQQRVWAALRRIPYGATWSYLDLALHVGDRGATRAVGAANGENPLAIVIPCHRVINADGNLGGYGGGRWRKRALLDLELGQGRLPL